MVYGQVLETLEHDSKPVAGGEDKRGNVRNAPMLPVVWWHDYKWPHGKTSRILVSTIGASVDFKTDGLRRVMVNGSFWLLGMEDLVTPDLSCDPVEDYQPSMFKTIKRSEDWSKKALLPAEQ